MKGKHAVFLRLGFEMRVGYTRRRNPLSRESGVISKSFRFSYFKRRLWYKYQYIYSFSNQIKRDFSFAATQQQQVSALHIPRNFFFLSAKDCYHLVWESRLCRYGSDTIFWIYCCWYDFSINAYDCQGSQNGMEPLNVYVWKMRMQLLLKEQDPFFHSWEKRGRSGANGFFNQVSDDVVVAKQQKKAYEQHR